MSVNGDLMVVRNGRSTSQVSVYNYPEHLNPFYEDDNHKRLRFWKINKNAKDGQGRRSSFSLGGIKDMWAFKSFRMKKKSSSLGINKTSESPPPLRREMFTHENGYSTYDPRMRYTTGATNGLGADNAFQRNVPYRSSLQDMRNTQPEPPLNGIGFNRNDRYRSTIQTPSTSGTSASSPAQSLTLPPPRRSSQASVASTNPFDDDDDDDDVVMGGVSGTSTPSKHPARKKRRAPPPPVPVHQIIKEENSSAGSTPSHKPSNAQVEKITAQEDERLEIQNLTAEIESFVKSSTSDTPEREVRSSTSTTTTTTRKDVTKSPKQNGTITKGHASPAQKSNGPVNSEVDIIVTTDAEPLFIREEQDVEVTIKKDSPVKVIDKQVKPPVREVGHVEVIHVHVESPRSSPEKTEPSRVSTFRSEVRPESPKKSSLRSSPEKAVASTRVEIVEIHKSAEQPVEELKIKESPEKPPIAVKPNIPKSPPPVSPRLGGVRRNAPETPDTPAMKRREIKIEADLPSTPESIHREIGIDADSNLTPTPKRQAVTVKVERVTTTTTKVKEEPSTSDIVPVPTMREHRPTPAERTSPSPAARKVLVFENEVNLTAKQEPKAIPTAKKIEVEEKISNLDAVVPTTISELQLKISESEENIPRTKESTSTIPLVVAETNQQAAQPPEPTPAASTSTSNGPATAHPAPIEKPPRAKHFAEENSDTIYRPRPSQWMQSTLAPLEPVPPEKRRSVKQIIESINRSQRLLNGKKEDESEIDPANAQRNMSETNTNAMEQNLKSLAESQREMKRMLEELDGLENAHERKLSNKSDENFQGILDTIVSTLARETAKKTDADKIFKKCTITKEVNNTSRESSPTSSNLDWNPVPKPKRTKNLSPDLDAKKNNDNNNNIN